MESIRQVAHSEPSRGMANISCFCCEKKFHTSQMVAQHIREEHLSFVDRGVPRNGPDSQPIVVNRKKPEENDSYKNTIAKCPYCSMDCQTRKKLMRHLELEHKDEVDHEEETPDVKLIRLSKPDDSVSEFSHSSGTRTSQSFSPSTSTGSQISNPKTLKDTPTKPATKHQYKCFWCDASFRKRGKLMDHIDSLHKQQNQAEADMLSNEDTRTRPSLSTRPSGPMFSTSAASSQTFSRKDISTIQSNNICTFKHSSFVSKPKQNVEHVEPPRKIVCTFYLHKTDNPLVQRRPSLPIPDLNEFCKGMTSSRVPTSHPDSFMGFPPQVVSPMAALQQSYMFGLRPSMMLPNNFYPGPRMPMMVTNDYVMGRRPSIMEPGHTQIMARLNALSQMNPRIPFSPPLNSNSPLDLSKNL